MAKILPTASVWKTLSSEAELQDAKGHVRTVLNQPLLHTKELTQLSNHMDTFCWQSQLRMKSL